MQVGRAWCVLVALALPIVSSADGPTANNAPVQPAAAPQPQTAPTQPLLNARLLARSDALVSYCAKADPSTRAKYQDHVKRLVKGANAAEVTRVRSGEEYRKARGPITEFLGKIDERNSKRACTAYLPRDR